MVESGPEEAAKGAVVGISRINGRDTGKADA
jgi:hypothetical protein